MSSPAPPSACDLAAAQRHLHPTVAARDVDSAAPDTASVADVAAAAPAPIPLNDSAAVPVAGTAGVPSPKPLTGSAAVAASLAPGAPPRPQHPALAAANAVLPVPLNAASVAYLISGAAARMCGAVLTCPLDTLKARVQFSQRSREVKQYASAADAARRMWRQEGVRSFYRGLPARLAYVGPAAAVSFLFYEQFRHMFHRPKTDSAGYLKTLAPLAAAGVLRVAGTTLRTPFDVVRQRMQVMGGLTSYSAEHLAANAARPGAYRGLYRNSLHAMTSVVRTEGVRALFSGVGVTIMRDIPFSVTYFLAYESFRTLQQALLGGSERDDRLSTPNHMLSGALGAACGVVVSNPLDVAKTRLQTQGSLREHRYSGVRQVLSSILREDGPRGFLRGLGPRLLYLCPSAAVTFALYELFKKGVSRALHVDLAELAGREKKKAGADVM